MAKKNDLVILAHLRKNGRKTLTELSKATSIPISTIFERLKVQQNDLIKKFTVLLDFQKLGFHTRAAIMLKVKKTDREPIKKYILASRHVNSCFRINNGYDLLIEGIFRNIQEVEEFLEYLEENYTVEKQQVYYMIDTIKEEEFLSSPEYVQQAEFCP